MSEKNIPYKIYLDESEIPQKWYNLRADMKNKSCNTSALDSRGNEWYIL